MYVRVCGCVCACVGRDEGREERDVCIHIVAVTVAYIEGKKDKGRVKHKHACARVCALCTRLCQLEITPVRFGSHLPTGLA